MLYFPDGSHWNLHLYTKMIFCETFLCTQEEKNQSFLRKEYFLKTKY